MTLTFLRDISWEEVLSDYRALEEESWREHYQSEGFETWDEWRGRYFKLLKPEERSWSLYRIDDPMETIPEMFVGPFHGWKQYYSDREHSRFLNIANHPTLADNPKVRGMFESFPSPTRLIGLRYEETVMLMEGTHRAATIALAARLQEQIDTELTIALSDYGLEEAEEFDAVFNNIAQVTIED